MLILPTATYRATAFLRAAAAAGVQIVVARSIRLYWSEGAHRHQPPPPEISPFVASVDAGVVSVDPRVLSLEPGGIWG